jgi:hypothetical protein
MPRHTVDAVAGGSKTTFVECIVLNLFEPESYAMVELAYQIAGRTKRKPKREDMFKVLSQALALGLEQLSKPSGPAD